MFKAEKDKNTEFLYVYDDTSDRPILVVYFEKGNLKYRLMLTHSSAQEVLDYMGMVRFVMGEVLKYQKVVTPKQVINFTLVNFERKYGE